MARPPKPISSAHVNPSAQPDQVQDGGHGAGHIDSKTISSLSLLSSSLSLSLWVVVAGFGLVGVFFGNFLFFIDGFAQLDHCYWNIIYV